MVFPTQHSTKRSSTLGAAIRGAKVGLLGALVLMGADRLEQKALGRRQIYAPFAIAHRLFGARSASVRGLALRAAYSAGLGTFYAMTRDRFPRSSTKAGLTFGAGIWAFELVAMPIAGAVPRLREWPRAEIALLLAHALVFGMTATLTYDRLALVERVVSSRALRRAAGG